VSGCEEKVFKRQDRGQEQLLRVQIEDMVSSPSMFMCLRNTVKWQDSTEQAGYSVSAAFPRQAEADGPAAMEGPKTAPSLGSVRAP
jgi:hypothetical protein